MIRPILAYGHDILTQQCEEIGKNFPDLNQLIADMWETMRNANGCGLAAPQIEIPIRLFVVDSKSTFQNLEKADRRIYFDKDDKGIVETFINAKIIDRSDTFWEDDEGCLSIPNLTQPIDRPWTITIEYCTKDFTLETKTFSGTTARMIQHEYDHTEGILYLDYLKSFSRTLLKSKLRKIQNGDINPDYPMKFV